MPLTFDQLHVGMRVRSIHYSFLGRTGSIIRIYVNGFDARDRHFLVVWDDNNNRGTWYTAEYFEELITNKDLKCSDCDLPAYHAEANLPDNKYVCDVCKTIRDLS